MTFRKIWVWDELQTDILYCTDSRVCKQPLLWSTETYFFSFLSDKNMVVLCANGKLKYIQNKTVKYPM